MTIPLILSKFYVPVLCPAMVTRTRLYKQLDESTNYSTPLILVSAPAGFGKTTLIAAWLRNRKHTFAWISLDQTDNHPVNFWYYFIHACQSVLPNIGKSSLLVLNTLIQEGSQRPCGDCDLEYPERSTEIGRLERVLITLSNEIYQSCTEIFIVLDDYHFIENPVIHDSVSFLLDHNPSNLHLIISTRHDPPLRQATLRARGQLIEVRISDLKFNLDESSAFLMQRIGPDLSLEDIITLEQKTEGWVAGLQMAAISIRNLEDPTRFIANFSGIDRFILDYLLEEVLKRQESYTQNFLLQTSILGRMNIALCDAIIDSGNENISSRYIFEELERRNLFLIPLDNERNWYRYHHLFSGLLREQLRKTNPSIVNVLHQRASKWLEDNGFIDEAIQHALVNNDFESVANIIEKHALDMVMKGWVLNVLDWSEKLPLEIIQARPDLCIILAWAHAFGKHIHAAKYFASLIDDKTKTDLLNQNIPFELTGINAFLSIQNGNSKEAIQPLQNAIQCLPDKNQSVLTILKLLLAIAFLETNQESNAQELYSDFRTENPVNSNNDQIVYILYWFLNLQAKKLRNEGHLNQAAAILREALQQAMVHGYAHFPSVGWLYLGLGQVVMQQNCLDEAEVFLQKALELDSTCLTYASYDIYYNLIRIKTSQGDVKAVDRLFDKLEQYLLAQEFDTEINDIHVLKMNYWLSKKKLDEIRKEPYYDSGFVRRRISVDPVDKELRYQFEFDNIIYCQYLIMDNRSDEASCLLSRLYESASLAGHYGHTVEILALKAVLVDKLGDQKEALRIIEQSLNLAEKEDHIFAFTSKGEMMERFLEKALLNGIKPLYIPKILHHFELMRKSKKETPQNDRFCLSRREIQILNLLAKGHSNDEIARELNLSTGTIKVHNHRIYQKLKVNSRLHAISQAKKLKLIIE